MADRESESLVELKNANARTVLSDEQLNHLITGIKDYSLVHGLQLKLVRLETATTVPSRGLSVSVLPTPFPGQCFNAAFQIQPAMNELYMRIASDPDRLYSILEPLLTHDEMVTTLWEVWKKVREAGAVQDVICGVFRSDYMLHQPGPADEVAIKQVEMNAFSVAGACHSKRVAGLHAYLGRSTNLPDVTEPGSIGSQRARREQGLLPPNNNIANIVEVLRQAHDLYKPITQNRNCILMIVQPLNFNVADERPVEYALWDANTPCYRCKWRDVLEHTFLTPERSLLYEHQGRKFEVSAIYYRAGYAAAEYDEVGKATRLRLELSRAIKCPDILTHLTTFKTVQQALSDPATLSRFVSPENAGSLGSTFMPMHVLGTAPSGLQARALALDPAQASHYILKPNLEGGGHNIEGSTIPAFLTSLPTAQWGNYILMRRIQSPQDVTGVLITEEGVYQGSVVSELGILGTCLWRRMPEGGVKVLSSEAAGWTFKTKAWGIKGMNVVKGAGCFDCPTLTG